MARAKTAKDIITSIWKGTGKPATPKTPPVMSTSRELVGPVPRVPVTPPVDPTRLQRAGKFFFGSPKRAITSAVVGGPILPLVPAAVGGAIKGYGDILKSAYGFGDDPYGDITNAQLQTGAYDPMGVYDQIYKENVAGINAEAMTPQEALALMQSYKPGGAAGGSGRGSQGNIYGSQAAAGTAAAASPTGTATSGLTPVAGAEALAAEQLRNQGRSLQDYLNMVDRAASAAGVKLDQAGRQQLMNMGLAAYLKDQQTAKEQLAAANLARQQAMLSYGMLPQFTVTPEVRAQAEQLARGTGMSLQQAVDQLKRQYLFNLTQSQG